MEKIPAERTRRERRGRDLPRPAGIARSKHASGVRGAGANPDIAGPGHGHVGAAGGKRAFIRQRRRQALARRPTPRAPAIGGQQNHELSVDRIAERDPAAGVPERHRVEERARILVLELQSPRLAAVDGFVDPRRGAVADAEDVRDALIDAIDVPEIQLLRSWNHQRLPRLSAIGRSNDGAARAARPGHAVADRAHAAQAGRDPALVIGPPRTGLEHSDAARDCDDKRAW